MTVRAIVAALKRSEAEYARGNAQLAYDIVEDAMTLVGYRTFVLDEPALLQRRGLPIPKQVSYLYRPWSLDEEEGK